METLKTNISNAYSVAAATLDDSESAAKNEIHLTASQLDRLHEARKEKLLVFSQPPPSQKKDEKKIHKKQLTLMLTFIRMMNLVVKCPEKRTVSVGNMIQKQKSLVLCNLREMMLDLRGKNPNVKLVFSKFCTLRPIWRVLAGSTGIHCLRVQHTPK